MSSTSKVLLPTNGLDGLDSSGEESLETAVADHRRDENLQFSDAKFDDLFLDRLKQSNEVSQLR